MRLLTFLRGQQLCSSGPSTPNHHNRMRQFIYLRGKDSFTVLTADSSSNPNSLPNSDKMTSRKVKVETPKPLTLNPKPLTLISKPQTLNPKP